MGSYAEVLSTTSGSPGTYIGKLVTLTASYSVCHLIYFLQGLHPLCLTTTLAHLECPVEIGEIQVSGAK